MQEGARGRGQDGAEGQEQEGAGKDIQARLRRAPEVIVPDTCANRAQRTRRGPGRRRRGQEEAGRTGRDDSLPGLVL